MTENLSVRVVALVGLAFAAATVPACDTTEPFLTGACMSAVNVGGTLYVRSDTTTVPTTWSPGDPYATTTAQRRCRNLLTGERLVVLPEPDGDLADGESTFLPPGTDLYSLGGPEILVVEAVDGWIPLRPHEE